MKKITIKQKIGLVFFGIFLALLLVELFLRMGGYVMLSIQRSENKNENKNEYVILCLGESTTANLYLEESNWPAELEKILNSKGSVKKFQVINEGIVGTTTTQILANLEGNLKKYQPDMVIAMMGINDAWTRVPYGTSSKSNLRLFLGNLRLYKLGNLLFLHCSEKVKNFHENEIDNIKEDRSRSYQEYIDLGWEYIAKEEYEKAEEAFKKAIEIDPKTYIAYTGLGWSYRNRLTVENVEKAEEAFKKAIELNPGNDDAYEGLAWVYTEQNKPKLAELMLKKAIEINPNNSMTYVELAILYKDQYRINETIETLKKSIEIDPVNERAYLILKEVYMNLSMNTEAEEAYQRILQIRLNYYNPILVRNYQQIYDILNEREIKLFIMQYPVREIEEFKNFFTEEQQKNIVFISNKENFEEVLENVGYDALFIDRFAGDFGHCTLKGNRLMAENVANVILKELERYKEKN